MFILFMYIVFFTFPFPVFTTYMEYSPDLNMIRWFT